MKIIILGPTGSGKSIQARFISKLLHIKHINVGEEYRKIAKKNKKIKDILSKGKLVPNKTTINLVNELAKNKNYILDGFPRNLIQAKSIKNRIDLVIFLRTSKKEMVKRLLLRKREDDIKKNIEKRYEIYLKNILPILHYYKKLNILKEVDGNPSIKDVSKNIKKILIRYQQQL
jgi:adenylate kinase